jgi:transcriptional regulator with XRE-family HTH domain
MPRRRAKPATPESVIGARISEIRKRQAMTQVQLAAAVGMDQSLLSRYERGVLRLHGALVADLAKALHVTADELLGLKEPKPNGVLADRRVVRRIQQIERLPRRKKEILLATIDSFLRGESVAPR